MKSNLDRVLKDIRQTTAYIPVGITADDIMAIVRVRERRRIYDVLLPSLASVVFGLLFLATSVREPVNVFALLAPAASCVTVALLARRLR